MNEKACVYSLVAAIRDDMRRGIKKEDILNSLSMIISRDLFSKVKSQL